MESDREHADVTYEMGDYRGGTQSRWANYPDGDSL